VLGCWQDGENIQSCSLPVKKTRTTVKKSERRRLASDDCRCFRVPYLFMSSILGFYSQPKYIRTGLDPLNLKQPKNLSGKGNNRALARNEIFDFLENFSPRKFSVVRIHFHFSKMPCFILNKS
jgi:hypothetical protein